ncbi:MAG: 6-phosphogluconolactonase, partial [Hoeflea sp.]
MKATDHDRLSPSLRHHEFTDGAELAGALATKVGAVLQAAITARGQARLAVSGGSTPKRFFEALALEEIDWTRVTVTLID